MLNLFRKKLGKFYIKEVNKKDSYVKTIRLYSDYEDGKKFELDKEIIADKLINLKATEKDDMGGFNVANNRSVLRWLLRGDTLCDVIIPDDTKIYETFSNATNHGTFRANKIILTNPRRIDDDLALELYKQSDLPWKSYIQILAYISAQGFSKTSYKILKDKIDSKNAKEAMDIFDSFLERRTDPMPELYIDILNKIKEKIILN